SNQSKPPTCRQSPLCERSYVEQWRHWMKASFSKVAEGILSPHAVTHERIDDDGSSLCEGIGPVVEHVAQTLFDSKTRRSDSGRKSRHQIPTLLTEANRSRGRC